MSGTNFSSLRKRQLESGEATSTRVAGEVDIASCATIVYSSENPAHPIDHLLDGRGGVKARICWKHGAGMTGPAA